MSLIPGNAAADINTAYGGVIQFPPVGDFPNETAVAYDAYAEQGQVSGAVNNGGDFAFIEDELRAGPTNPQRLGEAFSRYWATVALIPDGSNTAVANDARAKEPLFVDAVQQSLTTTESNPPFEQFVRNVVTIAVKAVLWTVTSSDGSTTVEGIT